MIRKLAAVAALALAVALSALPHPVTARPIMDKMVVVVNNDTLRVARTMGSGAIFADTLYKQNGGTLDTLGVISRFDGWYIDNDQGDSFEFYASGWYEDNGGVTAAFMEVLSTRESFMLWRTLGGGEEDTLIFQAVTDSLHIVTVTD